MNPYSRSRIGFLPLKLEESRNASHIPRARHQQRIHCRSVWQATKINWPFYCCSRNLFPSLMALRPRHSAILQHGWTMNTTFYKLAVATERHHSQNSPSQQPRSSFFADIAQPNWAPDSTDGPGIQCLKLRGPKTIRGSEASNTGYVDPLCY